MDFIKYVEPKHMTTGGKKGKYVFKVYKCNKVSQIEDIL